MPTPLPCITKGFCRPHNHDYLPVMLKPSTTRPNDTIAIIGAGAAGLVTAHTLLQDGFDVQILTRDISSGGVWARNHIYPGLRINKYVSSK